MTERSFQTRFAAFWPVYLSLHATRGCRVLHFLGTTLGLVWVLFTVSAGAVAWAPLGLVFGYAFAWVGHFIVEKNRPATFGEPLLSFVADFRMWSWMARGRLWHKGPARTH